MLITAAPSRQRAAVRGDWTAVGEAPLLISDPLKVRWLLGLDERRPSARANVRHALGVLPVTYFRRTLPLLKRSALRELERLVSGGDVLFREAFQNIVVNQGLDDLLDVTLSGATQDTTWFVGLTDGTPTVAAGDTLASHAGWVERSEFDETNRVAWVDAGAGSQSITNSASPAAFTINATVTVGGAFLSGVNTGTAGRMYAAGAFTQGDKTLNDNDSLAVTATFTTAAA